MATLVGCFLLVLASNSHTLPSLLVAICLESYLDSFSGHNIISVTAAYSCSFFYQCVCDLSGTEAVKVYIPLADASLKIASFFLSLLENICISLSLVF
jgi:hypothetical protein